MSVCHAWQHAVSAAECTDAHVGRLHAKLTQGRDARRRPDPLPTARASAEGRSNHHNRSIEA
eukprot:2500550-Prymnesium_polylepis.1